jgi:hypothetical protein
MADPFARLHLTGGRFDTPGMPLEALVELARYRDLILGVARAIFLQDNPDRQRMPRGFYDRLDLRLNVVEEGSVTPVVERRLPDGAFVSTDDYFTRARDIISHAVEVAAADDAPLLALPPDTLVLFNPFGQTLRSSEAIELRTADASSGPTYTSETRRRLLLSSRKTFTQEVQGIAWVHEVDGNAMSCRVRLKTGPSWPVAAPLDEVTFSSAKAALEPNGEGPPVRVFGVGVFDAGEQLLRLDSIQAIDPLDDDFLQLDARLDEIATLNAGWLDGEGVSPDVGAVERARALLAELLAFEVPRPRVFATVDGGVQAEWTVGELEISLTFESDGGLYAVSVNRGSGASEEPQLSDDDLAQFAALLKP